MTATPCSFVVPRRIEDGEIDASCGRAAVLVVSRAGTDDLNLCKRHATDARIDLAWQQGSTVRYIIDEDAA